MDCWRHHQVQYAPNYPFEYHFLDENIRQKYTKDQQINILSKYFTLLAILIACLGLFGLSSFISEQRKKEIGIRKALGASWTTIVYLLSRDLTKWILVANILAWPVACFIANKWLHGFTYRTNINVSTFLFSALFVLIISLLTISYQILKTAYSKPVS